MGILNDVKKFLGIDKDIDHFDQDLIMHINGVFMILRQLGVGPKTGFSITGNEETWNDYLPNINMLEAVKPYVFIKVKMIFDPPMSSSVSEAYNKRIDELEWRLNVEVDPGLDES